MIPTATMSNELRRSVVPLDTIPYEQRQLDQVFLAPYFSYATDYLRHHHWFGAPVVSVAQPELQYRNDGIPTPDYRSALHSAKGKISMVYGAVLKRSPDNEEIAEPVPYVTVSYTQMDSYLVTTHVDVSFLLDYTLMRLCTSVFGSCTVTPYGAAGSESSGVWHRADGIFRSVKTDSRLSWSGLSEKTGIELAKYMFSWEHLDALSEARGIVTGSSDIKRRVSQVLSPVVRYSREYPSQ